MSLAGAELARARIGVRDPILAIGFATDDGARLELHNSADDATLRVDLRTRAPAQLLTIRGEGEPRVEHSWAMVRGVALHNDQDVLRHAMGWALRRRARLCEPAASLDDEDPHPMLQMYALLSAIATAAVERCAVEARSLAMRFRPDLRFRVYARIVADRSGRLADLVFTCPGALIFAFALIELEELPSSAAIGERLLAEVVAGRRLRSTLDDAVDGWLATIPELLVWLADPKRRRAICLPPPRLAVAPELQGLRDVQTWQRALDPSELVRLRVEQRILIRRAGTQVATTTLWLPPPIALVPDDIPRDTRANARWFGVMKLHPITLAPVPGVPPESQAATSRFLSRHASQLEPELPRRQCGRVRALVGHARATGRWPRRGSDVANVVAACDRWLVEETAHEEMIEYELPAPRFSPSALDLADIELTPLVTRQGLIREGREMRHCVRNRAEVALQGEVLVFCGVAAGERVTVELVRRDEAWALGDFRGVRNRPPSERATLLIRAWAAIAIEHQQAAEGRES